MQTGEKMFFYRRRWLVIIGAIVLIGIATVYGGGLFPVLKSGGFDVPSSSSAQAQHILDTYLHGATPDVVILMQADGWHPGDQTVQSDAQLKADAAAQSMLTTLSKRKEVSSVISYYSTQSDRFISKNGLETFALVQFSSTDETVKEDNYTALEPLLVAPPLHLTIGGNVPFNLQLNHQISTDLEFAEMVTFPILGILLVIVFGGVISALLPLLIGGITIISAFAVLRVFSNVTDISVFAINIVTMLGLGLAIDYALLIVTRFREELVRNDQNVPQALYRTMGTAGRAVIFSGMTVSVSLSALLLFPEMFLRSLGLGAIASVLLALLCAITILPTILALLGRRINWLTIRRSVRQVEPLSSQQKVQGVWAGIAHTVMRWPVPVIIGVIAILVTLGWPFLGASFSTPDVRVLPANASARNVADRQSQDFAQQGSSQVVIAITTSGNALSATNLAKLNTYMQQIKGLHGVVSIESLVTVDPRISLDQYTQGYAQPLSSDPELAALQQQLAPVAQQLANGSYTKATVYVEPANLSADAQNLVRKIRALTPPQGLTPLVGGSTAHQMDLFANLQATIPPGLALIAASIFILLFLMTGSILVPLKAVFINLLSLTATFGALVWIFQQGHFEQLLNFQSLGSIDGTQPILIFATAFGLSMDYEVFLLSRIKEEYDHTGNNQWAVSAGLQRTGGLITSAALLLAVVLGAFSTSHIIFIKEIGVGLAIAVLMDASIIRVLLVPATMRLLGKWNWWAPKPLQAVWRRFGLSEAADEEKPQDGAYKVAKQDSILSAAGMQPDADARSAATARSAKITHANATWYQGSTAERNLVATSQNGVAHDTAQRGPLQQIVITITTAGNGLSTSNLAALEAYVQQIEQLPGIVSVESLVSIPLQQYQQFSGSPLPNPQPADDTQQLVEKTQPLRTVRKNGSS